MRTLHGIVIGLVVSSSAMGTGFAQAPAADRLVVVQDESSMERTIERYLVDSHKLIVKEKTDSKDPSDMFLELPFTAVDNGAAFRIVVDTQSSNRDKDTGKVKERAVLITLYTGVKASPANRSAVVAMLDDLNRRKIFASFYLDTDGEILNCWVLNVLDVGLPTEYVYDAIARVDRLWREFWPQVAPIVR